MAIFRRMQRYFFDVGTWFCMVLNIYNKKKKVAGVCPNIFFFFSVSRTRKWYFSHRIPHIASVIPHRVSINPYFYLI
ncbi:hypothetical protein TSAR_008905 [Trichomalopsis sarcophagae]|uniref:Uncharacterized protein n=1 Tax=Trichomalopsis sarcophagae TaxID=543379 RepID=A0A232EVH3_9HYME|nr:hypothetical protein TSAR_008905 [Trichomalopsis sarcophagae]